MELSFETSFQQFPCVTCKLICDQHLVLYQLTSALFIVNSVPPSRNSAKEICHSFTFPCIALLSLILNPKRKTFSIAMFLVSFLNKIENPLLFLTNLLQEFYNSFQFLLFIVQIQCFVSPTLIVKWFTINITNCSLLLTCSLHFRLI